MRAANKAGALALVALGFGFGLLTLVEARSAPGGSFGGTSWVAAVAELGAGYALITAGVAEYWRRPSSCAGLLLACAGIGWFFTDWNNQGLGSPVAFTFGLIVAALAAPLVAHAALAYPAGRFGSRPDLGAALLAYAGAGLMLGLFPALFFDPARQGCGLCPANLVLVRSEPGLFHGLVRVGLIVGIVWAGALLAAAAVRMVRVSPPLRRMIWPVLVPAGFYLVLVAADFAHSLPRGTPGNDPLDYRLWIAEAACLVLMALGVTSAWMRDRRTRSAIVRLVMDASQSPPAGGLRDVLAHMLGDSNLDLAYLVGEPPRHVRADGQLVTVEPGNGQDVTSLTRDGRTVATLRHRAGLLDDGLIREVVSAARLGMENERLRAEILAQLEDLRAARARIVATGDTERRRLERDLHDGAQQRLVSLSLSLRMIQLKRGGASALQVTRLIDQADQELRLAIEELRDLARGIYPAVLVDEGLAAAVEALTESSPIAVAIANLPQERLPDPVEAAGYFLIAEACGLIAATTGTGDTTVLGKHDGERLTIQITSDAAVSSHDVKAGLSDVADRVGALGGSLSVTCMPDGAITITAEMPCAW